MGEVVFLIKEHYGVSLCYSYNQSLNRQLSREYCIQVWQKNKSLLFIFFGWLMVVLPVEESIQLLVYSECLAKYSMK